MSGAGNATAFWSSLILIIVMFVAFYLLIILPENRRRRQLQKQIAELQKGDEVLTAGGLMGKVTKIKERSVVIEIAPNVEVEIFKDFIIKVEKSS